MYRVINSLVQDEYLVRREDFSGFMLGTRVVELAALVGLRRPSPVRVTLDEARRATGEVLHLLAFT